MRLRILVPLAGLLALAACKDEKAETPPTNPVARPTTPVPANPASPVVPAPATKPPAEKPASQ
ncbi:hypothetical protein [Methylobacterium sp. 391_Methyba4]|uniref:hypothetical protein n=1 Tax=Methylobacterium sp. 391_Methyba4 TaxID=3038924 RepID=UPI00241EC872|nr:hypothetical protein [Methylobacterium sp. 391_Methyba4]WFS05453.1 hypothetical protein P9K36_18720 [Methylobacterium sp. 391_Methyba4]